MSLLQRYEPFFDDFGPLHLGMLFRFCKLLEEKLKDRRHALDHCTGGCARPGNRPRVLTACLLKNNFLENGVGGGRELKTKRIVFWTRDHSHRRANGAFLISCFSVIHLKWEPEQAFAPLRGAEPPYAPFKDVYGGAWNCTLLDCINAVYWAQHLGWLDFDTFNLHEYFFYERIENGDMNVIVPGRFVAFSDPAGRRPKASVPAVAEPAQEGVGYHAVEQ